MGSEKNAFSVIPIKAALTHNAKIARPQNLDEIQTSYLNVVFLRHRSYILKVKVHTYDVIGTCVAVHRSTWETKMPQSPLPIACQTK